MKLDIHPSKEFTTGTVADMLGIEGLTAQRIKTFAAKGLVPATRTSERGHYKIKFKDFDKVVETHHTERRVSRGAKHVTREEFDELAARVTMLEELYDMKLAPDWKPELA